MRRMNVPVDNCNRTSALVLLEGHLAGRNHDAEFPSHLRGHMSDQDYAILWHRQKTTLLLIAVSAFPRILSERAFHRQT
jgi:hypothetical protein